MLLFGSVSINTSVGGAGRGRLEGVREGVGREELDKKEKRNRNEGGDTPERRDWTDRDRTEEGKSRGLRTIREGWDGFDVYLY